MFYNTSYKSVFKVQANHNVCVKKVPYYESAVTILQIINNDLK